MVLEKDIVDTVDLVTNRNTLKRNSRVVAVVGFEIDCIPFRDFSWDSLAWSFFDLCMIRVVVVVVVVVEYGICLDFRIVLYR